MQNGTTIRYDSGVLKHASAERKLDFLLLMEDYSHMYTTAIKGDAMLAALPYAACAREVFARQIFYGDAYIDALTSQGLHADQVVPMCFPLQHKWAAEHHVWFPPAWTSKRPFRWYWTRRRNRKSPEGWALSQVLIDQLKRFRPKYLWVFSGIPVSQYDIANWRLYTERIILWWSATLWPGYPYEHFDLILSGIPALVEQFRTQGIQAAYLAHAFDRRILQRVPVASERIPRVAFVGSLTSDHADRIAFLDALARRVEIDFYGRGVEYLPSDSPLRTRYRGPAWGDDLYSVYGSYLVVFHKNIGVAGTSASAKRLFEATGMGACVIAETSDDMPSLFQPEHEIVTYSSFDDCVEKIASLLAHPQVALQIGQRAQQRTLTEHTYARRVQQILHYIEQSGF